VKKIAILLTTFLRDKLLDEVVNSIKGNWNGNWVLIVADQGKSIAKKASKYVDASCLYFALNFDAGLSFARNFLVREAVITSSDYCLITADSVKFTQKYDFTPIIEFMESNERIGIVGFDIKNRIPYEYDIDLVPGKYFTVKKPNNGLVNYNNIQFQKVDICRNFFLAKTQCLVENQWDEDLKLTEHESFAYELKKKGKWLVYWTNFIQGEYVDSKPPEYVKYRNRIYTEYLEVLKKKYNVTTKVKLIG
jgi:glycosyltransferase involved in cell wall biosynthesis